MLSFLSLAQRRRVVVLGLATALPAASIVGLPTASAADTTLGSDNFDRAVSVGWGRASTGGSWTVTGGTSSYVGSRTATVGVRASHSFEAALTSVSASDSTVQAAFTVPSGVEDYASVEARRKDARTSYRGRARIDAKHVLHAEVMRTVGGAESVLAQKTLGSVSAGQSVSVAMVISGTDPVVIKSKAWVTGTADPGWQTSASDSSSTRISTAGAIGVHGYVGPSNPDTAFKTQSFSATTTAAAPAAPIDPAPPVTTTPTSSSYGSATVGSTSYAVPSGAVFVASNGNDSAAGTQSAPVATVTKALTKVSGGGTIVVRGGIYHEYFIVPPGKNVTIQSYPKEAVWFDGSSTVSGFTQSGSTWKVDNWTTQFDASPTYTKGAPDGTSVGYVFLNPSYPMAAHPDQVWLGGAEQTQVSSLGQVVAGTFYVDYGAKRLYLGSNPSGKTVSASTLAQAVSLRAPGTVLRGIGFRRYADSVYMQGVITSYYTNMTLENVVVSDAATGGIGMFATGCVLRNVTVTGAGQLGLQAGHADGLVIDNALVRDSNDQNFNSTPSAGGFKVTETKGVTVKNSEFLRTNGNQIWNDVSTSDIDILNNRLLNGTRYGLVLEISSTATVADNIIAGNAQDGIFLNNTDSVKIWNNTLVNNGWQAISAARDTRTGSGRVAGIPWITRQVQIGNNIMTGKNSTQSGSYSAILLAVDWTRGANGNDIVSYSNGNVFSQSAVGTPKYAAAWSRAGTYAMSYVNFSDYVSATGRDTASYHQIAASPVDANFQPTADITSRDSTVGQPLPADVASKIGRSSGVRHLGAWQ